MEWIFSYVKNICVFTFVLSLVLNIFPESGYRKYIRLFAGFLLLIFVLNPLIRLFDSDFHLEEFIGDISFTSDTSYLENAEEIESKIYERAKNGKEEDQPEKSE